MELKNTTNDCDYNFDGPMPNINETRYVRNGNIGEYRERDKMILYLAGDMHAIHHEAFHHLSRNPYQTYYCLEQTAASLLSRVIELEERERICKLANRIKIK
jgi:hypothetical protein